MENKAYECIFGQKKFYPKHVKSAKNLCLKRHC